VLGSFLASPDKISTGPGPPSGHVVFRWIGHSAGTFMAPEAVDAYFPRLRGWPKDGYRD